MIENDHRPSTKLPRISAPVLIVQREKDAECTKSGLPCPADLDLLSSLLGSLRKLNDELQLYLQQADETSIKLPAVTRSRIQEKLEELLVRHGHYKVTDSDAEDSSSANSEDDATATATGSNNKNGQHFQIFVSREIPNGDQKSVGLFNTSYRLSVFC